MGNDDGTTLLEQVIPEKPSPITREEARQRGGLKVSADREHMSRIGRLGGRFVSQDREHMKKIGQMGGRKTKWAHLEIPQIKEIRRRHPAESYRTLALHFGVSSSTIQNIVKRYSWKDVE